MWQPDLDLVLGALHGPGEQLEVTGRESHVLGWRRRHSEGKLVEQFVQEGGVVPCEGYGTVG